MKRILLPSLFAALLFTTAGSASANWQDDLALNGYVRATPLAWQTPSYLGLGDHWKFTDLLHTRENFRWYPSYALTAAIEVKTQLIHGDAAQAMLEQTAMLAPGTAYFTWNRKFVNERHAVLVTTIDRFWADYNAGPVEVTLGRQRIAWGTNLVWNPIDLFNPSSPLDFDNEEKPGSDAGRLQVYLGPNSKIEAAVAPQRNADSTIAAAKIVLNKWEYDWILLAGRRGPESVAGGAWAGNILGGGFRGEILYAVPRGDAMDGDPYVTAAVDGDYTFSSSLYLHGSVLYNGLGTTGKAGGLHLLDAMRRGELTPGRLSLFAEVGRNLSPLVHVDLNGILNPYDHSWYIGPMLTWSVVTNLDLTAMGLVFGGDHFTEFGDNGRILMARLKYSF